VSAALRWLLAILMPLLAWGAARAKGADNLTTRRDEIASMQPAQQQELLRKQERFSALPKEDQDRLRKLQAEIDADPSAKELHQVLERYHEWLKTLTPTQRAELADMPPDKRVEQIQRIQRQQHSSRERARQAELLSRQDVHEVVKWTEEIAWKHKDLLVSQMSDTQRRAFEKNPRPKQALPMIALFSERARRGGGSNLFAQVRQPDIDRLAAKLSEPAKNELAAAGNLGAQRRKVGGWLGLAMHLQFNQGPRRMGPLVGEDLVRFLQNDVPASERERLLKLRPEEMQDELAKLRAMYFERKGGDGRTGGSPNASWWDEEFPNRGKGAPRGGRGDRSSGTDAAPRGDTPTKTAVPESDAPPKTDPAATNDKDANDKELPPRTEPDQPSEADSRS
jgi:hypothetical protein